MGKDGWPALVALAGAWAGYFALHSALADARVKRWAARCWPALAALYRLAYNALAIVLLLPLAWLIASQRGPRWWGWEGAAAWLANALALAALAVVLVTLRHYDGSEFLGLRQWAARRSGQGPAASGAPPALRLSPAHRYVRHPWYGAALVFIWTRDMDAATLVSALAMSVYFVVGARLEERRLVAEFGAAYRHYQRRVNALVPLPWKTIAASEAADIEAAARAAQSGRSLRV